MLVVVLLYRTNLPYSVETCPWCFWANRLPKLLEKLQLLLLTEHRLASGHALKLENEFGVHTPKLLLDLGGAGTGNDLRASSSVCPLGRSLPKLAASGLAAHGPIEEGKDLGPHQARHAVLRLTTHPLWSRSIHLMAARVVSKGY
jgi:hypothetical protein